MESNEQVPLKWPEGWGRTLIDRRVARGQWKKPYAHYRVAVLKELHKLGVSNATISRNDPSQELKDPGVSVWFSLKPQENTAWQAGLQLDSPMPTLAQIDEAYKLLARKHHPDAVEHGSGGDIAMFHKLTEFRKLARAWVLGTDAPALDNCIPCDRFVNQTQNLAAIASALRHFRGLELVGIPAILERVMDRAFKAALPAPMGGVDAPQT